MYYKSVIERIYIYIKYVFILLAFNYSKIHNSFVYRISFRATIFWNEVGVNIGIVREDKSDDAKRVTIKLN